MQPSTILVKYGGNAMRNEALQQAVIDNIKRLWNKGYRIILVHGGGPFIKRMLETAQVESVFIDGQRKTSPEALRYVEMALRGEVNGNLVRLLNNAGLPAVGLCGKDGELVQAQKRIHHTIINGKQIPQDLGRVGKVVKVNTQLLEVLLNNGFLPVLTCIASDANGKDYNINADLFAGHIAGAMKVDQMLMLTDVDGLLENKDDPDSLIRKISLADIPELMKHTVKGGMIPKMESCEIAIRKGAKSARIINGTKPETIYQTIHLNQSIGTEIC